MTVDDATLILRYQRGDKSALDTLISRHQVKAYQYAFRLTRDQDQACDVVADAFLRVCKSIGNFRGQSAFSTWLYRIVTNCFLDSRKKYSARPVLSLETTLASDSGDLEIEMRAEADSAQYEVERKVETACLQKAIDQLPESYRVILMLFHADMMSYEEISEILELPLGTVKSRLNRARLAMRTLLEDDREMLLAA
jgi:RNA polymerase sigma-70 factor (ECF subfamily)